LVLVVRVESLPPKALKVLILYLTLLHQQVAVAVVLMMLHHLVAVVLAAVVAIMKQIAAASAQLELAVKEIQAGQAQIAPLRMLAAVGAAQAQ
jgi:hypothetical protein